MWRVRVGIRPTSSLYPRVAEVVTMGENTMEAMLADTPLGKVLVAGAVETIRHQRPMFSVSAHVTVCISPSRAVHRSS